MSTLVDLAHLPITVSGGMPLDCLILCQNVLAVPLLVLCMVSNIHLILTCPPLSIIHVCQDSTTAWTVETVLNGGHFVMT